MKVGFFDLVIIKTINFWSLILLSASSFSNLSVDRIRVSEIDQDQAIIVRDHNVVRFYISMSHLIHNMHVEQSCENLLAKVSLQLETKNMPLFLSSNQKIKQRTILNERKQDVAVSSFLQLHWK
jgi:hypothetical protein